MERPPPPDSVDGAAWGSAIVLLVVTHLLGDSLFQYGAWLVVFTIWMAWFVHYGVRWLSTPA